VDWLGIIHTEPAESFEAAQHSEHQHRSEPASPPRSRPRFKDHTVLDPVKAIVNFHRVRRRYRAMAAILSKLNPALVVVGQDFLGGELSFLLIAAGRMNIRTLIVPFAMFNQRELAEYAYGRTENRVTRRVLNRLMGAVFPRWVLEWKGEKLLRLPAYSALPIELAGLCRGNPWVPCSEPVDGIACESSAAIRSFRKMGSSSHLELVGGPVYDRLAMLSAGAGRQALMLRHEQDPSRGLVACGWPANIFSWVGERRIAYASYTALAQAWARLLAAVRDEHGVAVIVSVHPKTTEEEIAPALALGLPVQRGNTEELIAHCDLFTTLNGSSITAWAIACAKPVLLFDCYETGYTDFDDVPGLIMTSNEDAFSEQLHRLCRDNETRDSLAKAQSKVAADWGLCDGNAKYRLGVLVDRMICMGSRSLSEGPLALAKRA
jgi:hypothetical protein